MPHFPQVDHHRITAELAAGEKVMVLLLRSGPVALVSLGAHNPVEIVGQELDGSVTKVFVEAIEGWSLAPRNVYEPGAAMAELMGGQEPASDAQAVQDAAYLEQWQAAFGALRAACDKSEDPDVAAAMANLEAIEVLADAGAPS